MNIIDKYEISSLTNFLDSFFSVQKRSQNLDKNFLTLEDNYRPYIKTLEVDNRLEIEVDLPGFLREEIVLEVVDSCLKLKSNEKLNKKSKAIEVLSKAYPYVDTSKKKTWMQLDRECGPTALPHVIRKSIQHGSNFASKMEPTPIQY